MQDWSDKTVLLAEDEALISLDLSDTLESAGYRVVGPVATVADAIAMVHSETPHMAIVDFMLRDGVSTELMRLLRLRKVPFVIHSGYRRDADLASECGDAPWLGKPILPHDLLITMGCLEHSILDVIPLAPKAKESTARSAFENVF